MPSPATIPPYPVDRDAELEQRTLDALEAAYERSILRELEHDARPEVGE